MTFDDLQKVRITCYADDEEDGDGSDEGTDDE